MDRLAKRVQMAMNLSFKEFAPFDSLQHDSGQASQGRRLEKIDVIVSFLALLERVKQGAVAAEQFDTYGDIRISHTASASVPRYG